jgi:hypothetical protein
MLNCTLGCQRKTRIDHHYIALQLDSARVCLVQKCLYALLFISLAACSGGTSNPSTNNSPLPPSSVPGYADLYGMAFTTGTLPPGLTDDVVYAPPVVGPYAYNQFKPGAAGFPAVGGTYVDPVFGGTIHRLTDIFPFSNNEQIYAHHWANADGTKCFSTQLTLQGGEQVLVLKILNPVTGAVLYDNQPAGTVPFEIAWHPSDPDLYYYYNGASLISRKLRAPPIDNIDNIVMVFPSDLESTGGSLNSIDRTGRYFTVRYNGTNKVWDSQENIIYDGEVLPFSSFGWVAITPDGNYLVNAAGPNFEHYSYAIDHQKHEVSSVPVNFWGLCGDHGDLMTASDGHNYFITFNCNNFPGVYRVDITKDITGRTEEEQRADNPPLIHLAPVNFDGHFSAVSKGALQDWVFLSMESYLDPFDGGISGWTPYEQEIIALNVITSEVRRLAHHRSRGLIEDYFNTPRISSSWDGSVILWTSNYNIN